jgi:hypothetical protein
MDIDSVIEIFYANSCVFDANLLLDVICQHLSSFSALLYCLKFITTDQKTPHNGHVLLDSGWVVDSSLLNLCAIHEAITTLFASFHCRLGPSRVC